MTPRPTAPASRTSDPSSSAEAALLAALAAAGDALTDALVGHDLDAIVRATREAEELVARLMTRDAVRQAAASIAAEGAADAPAGDAARGTRPATLDPEADALAARVGTVARRNATLLEHAWATDAAMLRMLATAARAESGAAGAGYGPALQPAHADPGAAPAGWLDRTA